VQRRGHAIECRIYAEDPENNFLPAVGRITHLHKPDGFGVREDSGVYSGGEISVHYDPMISKLIAWGGDREDAIRRMRRALQEYEIGGVQTTIPFCLWVMQHEKFRRGEFDTHFVPDEFSPHKLAEQNGALRSREKLQAVAALAAVLQQESRPPRAFAASTNIAANGPAWKRRGWTKNRLPR
jgi:propionyl-CoA carboxylase alpha chain